jgi:hypothetical protein
VKYRDVGFNPRGEHHFHKRQAKRLGYDTMMADSSSWTMRGPRSYERNS